MCRSGGESRGAQTDSMLSTRHGCRVPSRDFSLMKSVTSRVRDECQRATVATDLQKYSIILVIKHCCHDRLDGLGLAHTIPLGDPRKNSRTFVYSFLR